MEELHLNAATTLYFGRSFADFRVGHYPNYVWYVEWDSNPRYTDFKSVDSSRWSTDAY